MRANYIWNMAAGVLDAAEAVILSMIITRITGLNDAGIVTIAFAISNLFVTVGKYGVRSYQVTDYERLTFKTYLYVRYITVLLMMLFSAVYIINGIWNRGYSFYKAGSILCILLIFAIEAIEDVYSGACQRANRLDIGAKMFIIRWTGILLTYWIGMLITKNLLVSSSAALVVSFFLFMMCKSKIPIEFMSSEGDLQLVRVLKECLPLCIANFLNYYLCSAPKYVIDKYMNEDMQACFGFVSMPMFAIGLLSTFLYAPMLVKWLDRWNRNEVKRMIKSILWLVFIIIGMTVVCTWIVYLIGSEVLSILYSTDLSGYKAELLFMMGGGGIQAIVNLLVVVLTIMRKQIYIIACYAIAAVLAGVCFPKAVLAYQTCGAAIMYDIVITILLIMVGIVLIKTILNTRENEYEED